MPVIPKSRAIIALTLFLACATLLIGASSRRLRRASHSTQAGEPRITNKTSSILISGVHRLSDGTVEVIFSNQSSKPLYAYTIVTREKPIRKGMTVFVTTVPVERGQTQTERIPATNIASTAANNGGDADEIVFSAIYLEGGTIEGDNQESQKLKRTMVGMKEQAKLAWKILREASGSLEQDGQRLLETVESQVATLPLRDEAIPSSRELEKGKASVNERLLSEIKNLRQQPAISAVQVKSQLAELTSYYKRLAERL